MTGPVILGAAEAEALALNACQAAGASEATARSLVAAVMSAAIYGSAAVGFPHFVDYLKAFEEGRINRDPKPSVTSAYPAFLVSDADGGIAQLAFDSAFDDLVRAAVTFGVAVLTQANSYTVGELGFYVRRLAARGLVGIAATNANTLMVANAGGPKVYSTNPMAFGFPLGDGSPPLIIDQSSSATAYINVAAAAAEGRSIPTGWAVDEEGEHTNDARRALRGALLPFGGRRGANVALLVEMLSAGLSGGNWSLDAPHFGCGNMSPSVGLTVVAIVPGPVSDGLQDRARRQVARLQGLGVHVPGVTGRSPASSPPDTIEMPGRVYEEIERFAARTVAP